MRFSECRHWGQDKEHSWKLCTVSHHWTSCTQYSKLITHLLFDNTIWHACTSCRGDEDNIFRMKCLMQTLFDNTTHCSTTTAAMFAQLSSALCTTVYISLKATLMLVSNGHQTVVVSGTELWLAQDWCLSPLCWWTSALCNGCTALLWSGRACNGWRKRLRGWEEPKLAFKRLSACALEPSWWLWPAQHLSNHEQLWLAEHVTWMSVELCRSFAVDQCTSLVLNKNPHAINPSFSSSNSSIWRMNTQIACMRYSYYMPTDAGPAHMPGCH